jgi:hypothetical protein
MPVEHAANLRPPLCYAGHHPPPAPWSRPIGMSHFLAGSRPPLPSITPPHCLASFTLVMAPLKVLIVVAANPSRPPPPPSSPYKRLSPPRLTSPHPTPSSLHPLSHRSVPPPQALSCHHPPLSSGHLTTAHALGSGPLSFPFATHPSPAHGRRPRALERS